MIMASLLDSLTPQLEYKCHRGIFKDRDTCFAHWCFRVPLDVPLDVPFYHAYVNDWKYLKNINAKLSKNYSIPTMVCSFFLI